MYSLVDALSATDDALRDPARRIPRPVPTGFGLLDRFLSGGLRPGELCLLAGGQGVGKTALALQIARNVAAAGGPVVHVSYEQEADALTRRLIALESAALHGADGLTLRQVRDLLETSGSPGTAAPGLDDLLHAAPGGPGTLTALRAYGDHLLMHAAVVAPDPGGIDTLRALLVTAAARFGRPPLVVVDDLQKVVAGDEHAGQVAAGLRRTATELCAPVLAVAATRIPDDPAVRRPRIGHLRGPASLASEPDVVLMLTEKVDAVAARHLAYDTRSAGRFGDWVVLTVEKNRSGPSGFGLQLRKHLEAGRFWTDAEILQEDLADQPAVGSS